MRIRIISPADIAAYVDWLVAEEKSAATVEKYARDLRAFVSWTGGAEVTKDFGYAQGRERQRGYRRAQRFFRVHGLGHPAPACGAQQRQCATVPYPANYILDEDPVSS